MSDDSSLMMEAVHTSETSVDNHFTRQYIPEDNFEHHVKLGFRVIRVYVWILVIWLRVGTSGRLF
jgi:hypothetical protein